MDKLEFGVVNLGDNLPDPVTGRSETDADKHRRLIGQAVGAEAAGFDVFQLGEHHFNYYTLSSPVVALAAIAEHTRAIRLGTGVTLLPTRDPVLVAEEFATLDVLSGGRAEVTVGRGVFEAIFAAMDRDSRDAGDILAESIELLWRLLNEEAVTWSGAWRSPLTDVTIRPRSVQRPIPLWSGSSSALEQCARLGIPCAWVSVLAPFEALADTAAAYRAAWLEAGRSPDDFQLGIGMHCHVAATSQLARRRFAPYYANYLECSESIEKSRLRRRVRPMAERERLFETVPLVGSTAEVVDRLGAARDLLGLTRLILMLDLGGTPQDLVLEVTELLGAEVLPAVAT